MIYTFVPDAAESQSDIGNDVSVYKAPLESYKEPRENNEEQSESAVDEPYKEPREITIFVQYVSMSTTDQLHKVRIESLPQCRSKGRGREHHLITL